MSGERGPSPEEMGISETGKLSADSARYIREKLGMSVEDLSTEIGIDVKVIDDIEGNRQGMDEAFEAKLMELKRKAEGN